MTDPITEARLRELAENMLGPLPAPEPIVLARELLEAHEEIAKLQAVHQTCVPAFIAMRNSLVAESARLREALESASSEMHEAVVDIGAHKDVLLRLFVAIKAAEAALVSRAVTP